MSQYDEHDGERRHERGGGETPEADVHVPKWSPWIWIIPVLAVFFVGWLVVRYGFFGGGDITVRFAEARGLDRYSPVRFRGAKVGTVQKITIDEKLSQVVVRISMDASMNHALRKGTRFYRGGGFSLSLGGGGVSMGDASLSSLLVSPIGFYTPEVMAGAPVADGTRFELHDSRAAAVAAADGPHLTYLTYFPGPIRGLIPGTPVQMKGVQIGRVRDVRLRYVPQTASLETPVVLEIDPRELEFNVTDSTTRADLRQTMNMALQNLVNRGMRATLATSLVLPGASAVSLDIVARPGTGRLVLSHDPPIIPAAAGDRGLESAMASVTEVAETIRSLPLREIAGHMRSTMQRLDSLVNDPVLDQSLQRLDRSLAEIEKVSITAGKNIDPLVESLRNTATSAEAAAKRAQELMGSSQKQGYDVAELIRELTRAAEAVRALSSYLTENPDALLKGRRE